MCGRFTQRHAWPEMAALYRLAGTTRNLQAHYNIAPTDSVEVVVPGEGERRLMPMRWGLVPGWWKKTLKEVPATFNARAETVADKPMFRDAFRRRRCIVPASGYYEWRRVRDGRQPYYVSAADAGILSFAGLWDRWKNPDTGETTMSCTLIVTQANALTRAVHARMPVVLEGAGIDAWLGDAPLGRERASALMVPAAAGRLRLWAVSRRVNRAGAGDDDRTLLDAVTVAEEPEPQSAGNAVGGAAEAQGGPPGKEQPDGDPLLPW